MAQTGNQAAFLLTDSEEEKSKSAYLAFVINSRELTR